MANSHDGLWALFVGVLVLVGIVGIVYVLVINDDGNRAAPTQNTISYVPITIPSQIFEVPSASERLASENERLQNRVDSLERQLSQSQSSLQSTRLENGRLRDDLEDRRFRFRGCDDDCDDLEEDLEDEKEENDDLRDTIDELCDELDDHNIDSDEC